MTTAYVFERWPETARGFSGVRRFDVENDENETWNDDRDVLIGPASDLSFRERDLIALSRIQKKRIRQIAPQPSQEAAASNQDGSKRFIDLSSLYMKGSIIAMFLAMASLASWFCFAAPIVSPFVSVMILALAPFTYMMGRLSRHGRAQRNFSPI